MRVAFQPPTAALTKTALIITSLNLSTTNVRWWHDSGVAAGWLDPTTLPLTLQQDGDEALLRAVPGFINATTVRNKIPVQGATFATLFGAASGATKSDYLSGLAAMTQWPTATLEVL